MLLFRDTPCDGSSLICEDITSEVGEELEASAASEFVLSYQ
jgi:hypothetical protein